MPAFDETDMDDPARLAGISKFRGKFDVIDDPESPPGSVTIRLPSYELPPSMNSRIMVPKGTKTVEEPRPKIEVRYIPVPVNVNQPWIPVVHHYGHDYAKKAFSGKAAKKEAKKQEKKE